MPEGIGIGVAGEVPGDYGRVEVTGGQEVGDQPREGDGLGAGVHAQGLPALGQPRGQATADGVVVGEEDEAQGLALLVADAVAVVVHPSGLVQEAVGLVGVIGVLAHILGVGPVLGRQGRVGHHALAVQHLFHQFVPIQAVEEGLADGLFLEEGHVRVLQVEDQTHVLGFQGGEELQVGSLPGQGQIGGQDAADAVQFAPGEGGEDGGIVGIEAEFQGRDVGRLARVVGVRLQADALGADLGHLHAAGADRVQVQRAGGQLGGRHVLPDVPGQQAHGGVVQERCERALQGKAHSALVHGLGADGAPELGQVGDHRRVGGLDHLHGEENVLYPDGGAVVPEEVGAQAEGVDQPVQGDGPGFGHVGHDPAVGIQPGESPVEQGAEVLVHLVDGTEERIEVLGCAGDAFAEDPTLFRDDHGGDVVGGEAQQGGEEQDPREGQQYLPTDEAPQGGSGRPIGLERRPEMRHGDGLLQAHGEHAEQHEQGRQDDGQVEEGLFHASAGAVDAGVAAERAAQAAGMALDEDHGDQGDGDDDGCDHQEGGHGLASSGCKSVCRFTPQNGKRSTHTP